MLLYNLALKYFNSMPYPNEHSARVRKPEEFKDNSMRRKNIDAGVDLIHGKLSDGDDSMVAQAYRFDAEKFTAAEAKSWCKEHDIEYILFEEATNGKVNEGHIFIYGEIIPYEDNDPGMWGGVNLKDVVKQINSNKEANRLIIHIHSPGGDVYEGFAIHDALVNSGKEIETIIEGLCASIATIIALSGDRRLITQHSEFMIHNPWSFGLGDSEDLKKQSDELAKTEKKIAEFYASKTNLTKDELFNYMHEETFFTAQEAVDYGFMTEIVNTMKQVAKITNLNIFNMDKKLENKMSALEKLIDKVMSKFKPKDIMVADVNGIELDFPEVNDASEIAVGAKVNVSGNPETGEHKMPSGEIYVCESGVLNEIKPAPDDENEALKKENEALKAEVESLKSEKAKAETNAQNALKGLNQLQDEFKKFKSEFSKGNPADGAPPDGDDTKPKVRELLKTKNNGK